MSVREALDEFKKNNEKMKTSLSALRDAVKEQGSFKIQRYMLNNQFEEAKKIMKLLEDFVQVDLESNSDSISESVHTLFVDGILEEDTELETYVDEDNQSSEGLSFIEKEILEEIGYTAVSTLKDMKTRANQKNIENLCKMGYLEQEKVSWGKEEFVIFEFTEKAKLYFQTKYGIEAKSKKEQKEEYNLLNVEERLIKLSYQIIKNDGEIIEFKMENKSCYFMILTDNIENQMNRHFKFKNIAILCKNEDQIDKAIEQAKIWVTKNTDKSRYMMLHFTTMEKMTENPQSPFITIRF